MKKILFVLPFLSGGGAERVVSIWSSELAKVGVDIHILVFYRVESEYPINGNVKIHVIKDIQECYDRLSILEKIKLLRTKLKYLTPDLIIPFISHVGLMTSIARVGLNIKMVETIRIDPKYSPKNKAMRIFRNISVLLSSGCIVQNEEQKSYFPKWLHRKISVLANPVSNEFIQLERHKERTEIHSIVAVGRLEQQKNFVMLIKAFSNIDNPNLILEIYGEGSLKEELQSLINDLGLTNRIKLCGRSNSIRKVFANADLFILSSNAEGMPNSLMEAMAAGLPCISTDCPTGPSDLIDNGINGILIPVGDDSALVSSIDYMVSNPEIAFTMGQKAKEKIKKNYAADISAKKLLSYFNTVK